MVLMKDDVARGLGEKLRKLFSDESSVVSVITENVWSYRAGRNSKLRKELTRNAIDGLVDIAVEQIQHTAPIKVA